MEYKKKQRHRHNESNNDENKMRPIFLHMDYFLFCISLLEGEEPEVCYTSPYLISEILEHRHIVSGDILGSVLTIELCLHSYHLCLYPERASDHKR